MPLKCTGKQTKFAKTASGFLIGRCPKSNPAKPWIQLFLRLEKPAAAGPRRHSRTLPHHLTTSIKVKMASIVAQQLAAGYVLRAIVSRRAFRALPRWFCNRFLGNTRGWGWFRRRPGPALIPRASGKNRREVDPRCVPARVTLDLPERTSSAARHDAPSRRTSR